MAVSRRGRNQILTEMHPRDSRSRRAAHLTVEPRGAAFDDLQDVQLAGEQGLPGRGDSQVGARGGLLCE